MDLAGLKIVFGRHEYNLQYKSFAEAKKNYDKVISARLTCSAPLFALSDDFSRQVTITVSEITCVSVIDFKQDLEGNMAAAREQTKAQLELQRLAQTPPSVLGGAPNGFRLNG